MKKVEIIIHSLDKSKTELCLSALNDMKVPDEIETEILVAESVLSKGTVYNQLTTANSADYYIYVSEGTVVLDNTLLSHFLEAFENNEKLGALGVCGTKKLLSHCVSAKSPGRIGQIYDKDKGEIRKWAVPVDGIEECLIIDGGIFACRGGACWRTDILNDDCLITAAACLEQKRRGFAVAVLGFDIPAVACDSLPESIDDNERQAFLDEYEKEIFPLVSVVIPTYNRPEYFCEALNSVLNQTYRNLDIFITDNSHNTLTAELMDEYLAMDSRIKYEHHPEYDAGGNWCRALAYNNPTAEYVNWLMDDDLWHPEKISRMIDYFLVYDNVGLVTSVRQLIDKDGNKISSDAAFARMPVESTTLIKGQIVGKKVLTTMVNFLGEPTTVLAKKKYLLHGYTLGFSGEEGRYFISDYPTWLRVLAQSDMIYITEPLSSLRIHKGQEQWGMGSILRGTINWILEINYAWKNGLFFESEREYLTAVTDWLKRANETLSQVVSLDGYDDELHGFIEEIRKSYGVIDTRGKKCACCDNRFLYYGALPAMFGGIRAKFGPNAAVGRLEMLSDREYLCPRCNASDRERAYALWMKRELPTDKRLRILDIAPSKPLQFFIKRTFPKAAYYTMDLFMEDVDFHMDIMDMNLLGNGSIDFFICSHVLEYVRDDRKAMRELCRILSRDGRGIVVVPLDMNITVTDEDPDCADEAERIRRFGQNDHIRAYAKADFISRLEESGFAVEQVKVDSFGDEASRNGLQESATVYVVSHR